MSKARTDILEQAQAIAHAQRVSARYLPDEVAAQQPGAYYDDWRPDTDYVQNDKVMRLGQLYNIEQKLTSSAVYPPEAEGVLALYRPINPSNAGTLDDPIPWVYGMDCEAGLYYLYESLIYRCKMTAKPCVWAPGSEGAETIWEVAA